MQCPNCHSDTPDSSKFCISCGAALPARCPSCGSANPASATFCFECGHKLAEAPTKPATTSTPPPSRTEAERRQLTVMFVDLVGSTALSARLDPEDLREIIGAYHRCCAEQITKAGGFVAQYLGDGVLAYFGFPEAHEDDAERAVRTGLTLVDAVSQLRAERDTALQARIGVATGLVVVGDLIGGDARERGVVGETPNLAARLQAIAEPGQVVISHSTRRLAGGLFEYRDLGRVALKGLTDPVQAWQVIGASTVESRFEAQHEASLTPLVGRDEELELLLRRWQGAKSGEGQVVLLSGEPGIGKSRLTVALEERLQDEAHTRVRYFCSPHHTDSAFYPVISQLERAAEVERHDTSEGRLGKLVGLFDRSSTDQNDIQLLTELLSVPTDRYAPLNWTPQRRKEKTLEALLRQLEVLSRRRAVFVVYEDVHWIDPSTHELLDMTVQRVARLPVLLVITYRPEFQSQWTGQPHVSALALNRLDRCESVVLVQRVAGDNSLSNDIAVKILERSDGIPLFVEELTKAVVEAAARDQGEEGTVLMAPPSAPSVPLTLHASLTARLDRLGPSAKEIAQIGAAVGREFSYELLALVAERQETDLRAAIHRLTNSGLVVQRGAPPQAMFLFKHALVQDVAYTSLLKGSRRQLHARIADTLEHHFSSVADTEPQLIARHLTEAGFVERAMPYWLKAGEQAWRRSAYQEATAHLDKGLAALRDAAPSPTRDVDEIRLQNTKAMVLHTAEGPTPNVERAYARALSLCGAAHQTHEQFRARFGLWFYHIQRMNLGAMTEFSDQMLASITKDTEPDLILQAHHAAWTGGWITGHLQAAREHGLIGARLYHPVQHERLTSYFGGHNVGACCRFRLGLTLWLLGFPNQATIWMSDAVNLAAELKHPFTSALTYFFASALHQLRRETSETARQASLTIKISADQGIPVFLARGSLMEGWAQMGTNAAGALDQIRRGMQGTRAVGAEFLRPYFLGLLAEACLNCGDIADGLTAVGDALSLAENTGESWYRPELHRLRGALLARQGGGATAEAEAAFFRAISAARGQSGRAFELRASTSLARLWRDRGKRTEARDLLAPIYGWFTEGFDTPDLKEAKALLDELAA
jgi:class 3 adenylate cyclase/predicted ATPase